MISVDRLYKWVNFVARKKQSGAISPDEFNLAIAVIVLDYFKLKVGLPEEYQVGRPLPRQAYQLTQKITDDVRHLVTTSTINVSNSRFTLPNDYAAFSSLKYRYVTNQENCEDGAKAVKIPIEVVTDEEFASRQSSLLTPPTIRRPIANFDVSGIEVLPSTITSVELTYLKFPATPIRQYTIVNDEDVYSSTGTVNIDFPETCFNDIAIRVLQYYGINLSDSELVNFTESRKIKGQ